MTPALIDARPEPDFLAAHAPTAVGISLEELRDRAHELPPREVPLCVTDADTRRAEEAAAFLRQRGHDVTVIGWDRATATASGPSDAHLWRPNPFLVEAFERIQKGREDAACDHRRALDLACGSGRDAVWVAMRGYEVDAIDILPDALQRAEDLAHRCGVQVHALRQDLERQPHLGRSCYDLVTVFRFLHRALFPLIRDAVAPGGYIVYETFHEHNRQTGSRPLSLDHLLWTGELVDAFNGFELLIVRDAVERGGRYFSCLLARRPQPRQHFGVALGAKDRTPGRSQDLEPRLDDLCLDRVDDAFDRVGG